MSQVSDTIIAATPSTCQLSVHQRWRDTLCSSGASSIAVALQPLHDALHSSIQENTSHAPEPTGGFDNASLSLQHPADDPHGPGVKDVETVSGLRAETQDRPDQLPNAISEVIFVLVCSFGFLFSVSQTTNASVLQVEFVDKLDLLPSQAPWLVGSFLLASGLSVVVCGALADLTPPKTLMEAAFGWATVWSLVGSFSVSPSRRILFFVVRAMQGLACGALSSVPMSILGRVYKPGRRKNAVFATVGAMAPVGSLLGALQGGALQYHLPWVFGSSAIICAVCLVATVLTVPSLRPEGDVAGVQAPSFRDFDFVGATLAVSGCACVLAGLTQGSPTGWKPYTYALVILGIVFLAAFWGTERHIRRPLVSNRLWTTPGFGPLVVAYFLGFGSFLGCYQFFSFRFWLTIQHRSPLLLAAYKVPDAVVGTLATFIVARIMHRVRGHWILIAAMVFYAVGPAFFLFQRPDYPYWAVFPGIGLCALGPDLSFTAAAVFVTSSVERSYQGSAGSVLVTVQNLSAAIVTSLADSIASKVNESPDDMLSLHALRATWWFGLGLALFGAVICVFTLRMPKSEEKEHVA